MNITPTSGKLLIGLQQASASYLENDAEAFKYLMHTAEKALQAGDTASIHQVIQLLHDKEDHKTKDMFLDTLYFIANHPRRVLNPEQTGQFFAIPVRMASENTRHFDSLTLPRSLLLQIQERIQNTYKTRPTLVNYLYCEDELNLSFPQFYALSLYLLLASHEEKTPAWHMFQNGYTTERLESATSLDDTWEFKTRYILGILPCPEDDLDTLDLDIQGPEWNKGLADVSRSISEMLSQEWGQVQLYLGTPAGIPVCFQQASWSDFSFAIGYTLEQLTAEHKANTLKVFVTNMQGVVSLSFFTPYSMVPAATVKKDLNIAGENYLEFSNYALKLLIDKGITQIERM